MAYTHVNYKHKKHLKEALAKGEEITCFAPGLGPNLKNHTGTVYLEGPHYPKPHTWYAKGEMKGGVLVKVN